MVQNEPNWCQPSVAQVVAIFYPRLLKENKFEIDCGTPWLNRSERIRRRSRLLNEVTKCATYQVEWIVDNGECPTTSNVTMPSGPVKVFN
ncbi:hypothetical protein P8C59_005205 [Phyllachora maydis]|uniref:Uncharacterized protein n=1 Tax=Phyllachora maydis TaxID=1825666 RepID=A0AAD9I3Z3_9PEZI|nr:hypothetical protein P8C59_005205 [Phyllachora maydis]